MENAEPLASSRISELRRSLAVAPDDAAREALLAELAAALRASEPDEAVACLREAIDLARAGGACRRMSRHAIDAAELLRDHGRWPEAMPFLDFIAEAANLALSDTDREVILGQRDYVESDVAYVRADFTRARELAEQADRHWAAANFDAGRQAVQVMLGNIAILTGNLGDAVGHQRSAMELAARIGDANARVNSAYNFSLTLRDLGRWDDATDVLEQVSADDAIARDVLLSAQAVSALGEIFLLRDRVDKAVDVLRRAVEMSHDAPLAAPARLDALLNLGRAQHRRGDHAAASEAYLLVVRDTTSSGEPVTGAEVRYRLAELLLDIGDADGARDWCRQSRTLAREHGLRTTEAMALRVEGMLSAAEGDSSRAESLFEDAARLLVDRDDSYELALVRLEHGRLLSGSGDSDAAVRLLHDADRTFRRLGAVRESSVANRLLFDLRRASDADSALVEAVAGLLSVGLDPAVFCREVLDRTCDAYGYACGAVLARGQAVARRGEPDLARAARCGRSREAEVESGWLLWPVLSGDTVAGGIYLERDHIARTGRYPLALGAVAALLAGPLTILVSREVSAQPA